jgi:hypothetical protein
MLLATFAVAQESEPAKKQPAATSDNNTQLPAAAAHEPAAAAEVQTPAAEPTAAPVPAEKKHLKITWDNQFKYSSAFRLKKMNPKLVDASLESFNVDQRDGDLNFHRGLISDRADVLSEVDVTYGAYGVRASTAGWIDSMYNRRLYGNPTSNEFPYDGYHFSTSSDFQDIEFRDIELLDAFVFGKRNLGGQTTMSFRAGQFAQVWGQTLFFGNNGIAGGMVPVDAVKALAVPNSQMKEIMRPVPQASVQLEFGPKVTVAGYYQFEWELTRLPGGGSYFASGADFLMPGGKRFIIPGQSPTVLASGFPLAFYRDKDYDGHNGGQFGGEVLIMAPHAYDLGFYAIRFNDKGPQMNICPGCASSYASDMSIPGYSGTYYATYASNINAYAMSVTKSFGLTNYALEFGGRTNMDLVDDVAVSTPTYRYNNTNHNGHATGDTLHANFSTMTDFSPNKLAKESSLIFEAAWNDLLSITHNQAILDPAVKKQALAFEGIYALTYRQVRHGVDLMPQIGFSYSPLGKSSVISGFGVERGGNIAIGLTASYLDAWRASITYNTYYGPVYPVNIDGGARFGMGQNMADRDFIALSVFRSFGMRYSGRKTR